MASDRNDLIFKPTELTPGSNSTGDITLGQQQIRITIKTATMHVVSISIESEILANYLATDVNPGTPYVPQYPGSPATKKYVDDNIPTNVSDLTNDSNFQTATQVSQAISTAVSSAYKYKGSVASYSNLPASGNTEGDVWNVTDTGMNYAWTGSAWDALGATVDLSNYIAKDNTTAFTPSGDYNPSTKKYVDDTVASAKSSGATAPSNPTEGQLWYDTTNDQLKVYDGTNWNVVGDDTADINTKTFVLSSDSDKATATEAYKWYSEGNYPIIIRGNSTFVGPRLSGNDLVFTQTEPNYNTGNTTTLIQPRTITFTYDTSTEQVTQILYSIGGGISVLETNKNYSTPYTPQYNGSPATKKYVDDSVSGAVSKGTTAPSSPVEGQLWYDTTNDVLKVYDGTNWNAVGKEYNAGEGIEIKNGPDYSAMQGPAPDGFHVPLNTEWQAIYNIWTALGGGSSDGPNFGIALKLPFAGYRNTTSAGVNSQGSYGNYWSSSRYNTGYAYRLHFRSTALSPQDTLNRANGQSVRCFKNFPTVPTSSWTKLYGTSIEAGGIFWSSTDGLISLSSDGQTWITIMDKNLGATTVWNSGDTLSEANCGYYYQRGNNYGFAWTGTVTTSSTKVDASNYGPGNYYSSSTFITVSESPYRWDTTDNGNLRGGETGVVQLNNVITNIAVSDEAFSSSWDGDTTHAPSKNAIYDVLGDVETLLTNL